MFLNNAYYFQIEIFFGKHRASYTSTTKMNILCEICSPCVDGIKRFLITLITFDYLRSMAQRNQIQDIFRVLNWIQGMCSRNT